LFPPVLRCPKLYNGSNLQNPLIGIALLCKDLATSLVNRSWYEIALPMLWKEIGYQYGYLPDCDRLRKVLYSRPYPPPGLQHVQSPSLAQLVLKYCDNITDAAIVNIANKCPYLQHVSLKGCREITNVSVKELARKCQNLYYLNLSGCVSMRFANGTMEMLSSRCENLEYFNFKADDACFENNQGCSFIDDSAVYEVAKNCAKMEKINLRYCVGISSQAMIEIAKSCRNLRYINVSGCGNIQDDTVNSLLESCGRLQYVNLSGCVITDNIVHKAKERTRKTLIYVTGCSSISPETLQILEDRRNLYLRNYHWIRNIG
ncbi:3846_t:CDS:2, partial [Rhizophagus irregularis]